jgi:CheY-like chemotaxis protein
VDPLRILIADDHQAILDRLCSQLADEFEVVGAVLDGQAAFDAAVTLRPGAVVLDISMPRLSGLDVARRLSALPQPSADRVPDGPR